jgi:dTDP-4-amino-4,6-dideoxygalactose transaminase
LLIDGAQSFGASYGGKRLGAYGPLSTTSFFPSKPLGTYGDGGAIFCADSAQARTLRELRDHGRTTEGKVVAVGMNSRLAAIQAAVLLEKLAIFDDELARRRQVAARYRQLLGDSVVVVVPRGPSAESAWALLPVLLPHEFGDLTQEGTSRRSGLLLELISSGVPARLYYETPLHAYAFFGHSGPELPAAESLAKRLLFLPFHPYLSADDQERVVAELRVALGRRVP